MMPSTIVLPTSPVMPFHAPGTSGATPLAKRPSPLIPTTGVPGPRMIFTELNEFVCQLHFKIESMGHWASHFHDSMVDFATHIDEIGKRTAASFGFVKAETDSICSAASLLSRTR